MADVNTDTKYCSNCKKDIAAANFVMHEMHCRRHIVLCEHCQEAVPKSELDQHFSDHHATVSCEVCGELVEKNKLQHHIDVLCSKKPAQCSYCELEVPQCDLDSHMDYCGTRTEPCHLCGQFIMLKDQLQHESSGCCYPAAKPQENGLTGSRNDHPFMDNFQYSDSPFHPFAFGEISRILEQSRIDMPELRRDPSNSSQTHLRSLSSPTSRPVDHMRNDTSVRKSTTNRKSELNKKRERETGRQMVDDQDEINDRLLALQLAQDLDSTEDLTELIKNFEKHNSVSQPELPSAAMDLNSFPDDEVLMPCEFCDELFTADTLVQHQSGCDPLLSGSWADVSPLSESRNNEHVNTNQQAFTSIPVINNLERDSSPVIREIPIMKEWEPLDNTTYVNNENNEQTVMLPCEFCEELIPGDFLVQHQSVCDANLALTPRATTPAVSKPPKQKNTHNNHEKPKNILRSPKHQENPFVSPCVDFSDDENRDFHTTGFNDTRPELLTPASTKYGVPADRFDSYLTRPSRSDPHVQGRVRSSENRAPQVTTRKDTASRTRQTLQSLIQDDIPSGDIDYLATVNTSQSKALKNEDNLEKKRKVTKAVFKRGGASGSNVLPAARVRNQTYSEQRTAERPAHARGNRQRQPNSNLLENPPFQTYQSARGRQRTGNQIFNPSTRGNNSHK